MRQSIVFWMCVFLLAWAVPAHTAPKEELSLALPAGWGLKYASYRSGVPFWVYAPEPFLLPHDSSGPLTIRKRLWIENRGPAELAQLELRLAERSRRRTARAYEAELSFPGATVTAALIESRYGSFLLCTLFYWVGFEQGGPLWVFHYRASEPRFSEDLPAVIKCLKSSGFPRRAVKRRQ